MSDTACLVPLCHRGLDQNGLVLPYNYFQSYNLLKVQDVENLVRYISKDLKLRAPDAAASDFCNRILDIDRALFKSFVTFDEIAEALRALEPGIHIGPPVEVLFDHVEIWDELKLRSRTLDRRIIELSGFTREAMGFNLYNIPVPPDHTFLIIKIDNSQRSKPRSGDKLVKININRQDVKGIVPDQRDYNDSDYIVKSDGLFAFKLPPIIKHSGQIDHLSFTFWDIELNNLLLQLYLI